MEEATATPAVKSKSLLKPRILTSVIYVICWIGLCALKWTLPGGYGAIGFDAVFCAVAVIGSMEFLNAIGGISAPQRIITIAFAAIIVPLHVVVQMVMESGLFAVACAFAIYVLFLMACSVFDPQNSTVKGTIKCVFCMLYCGVLSAIMSSINHLGQNSMAAILVLFMTTVLTDTGAFVFGTALKKLIPLRLSPKLSPNKTVIGAVGGLLGGICGSIFAYLLIYYFGGLNGQIIYAGYNGVFLTFSSTAISPIAVFVLVGLATSVFAQVGDLFESAIKRECGLKDMGNLLPGHGGILDRFDSMLYCSLIVLLCFGTIII